MLLLLAGQRSAEVAGIRWSELKGWGEADPVWEVPPARTKNKQPHLMPLGHSVVEILDAIPRFGPLVFTTTGSTPVSEFGRAKDRIDERRVSIRVDRGPE